MLENWAYPSVLEIMGTRNEFFFFSKSQICKKTYIRDRHLR